MNSQSYDLTLERGGERYKFYASFPSGSEREQAYRTMAQNDPRVLVEKASSVFGDDRRTDLSVLFQEDAYEELRSKAENS